MMYTILGFLAADEVNSIRNKASARKWEIRMAYTSHDPAPKTRARLFYLKVLEQDSIAT